jgi:uncharacterized membrane protein YdjX (TVP38/TMEM64 family)
MGSSTDSGAAAGGRRARAHARVRRVLAALWIVLVTAALYAFLFHRNGLQGAIETASSASIAGAAAIYFVFGCIRGFTLIPATALILVAVPFFRPGLLFALTVAGILVSSASVYWFAEALHLDELMTRRHQKAMREIETALRKYELPVIIGWSFFPFVPTDLICYVSGVMGVSARKVLVGVGLGEGAICAIYIFLGDQALRYFELRP